VLASGSGRHNKWHARRFGPPFVALHGTQKVAKTKLLVIDHSA